MTFSRGFPGCVVVFTSDFCTNSLLVVFFYENKWGSQHKFEILYHPRRRGRGTYSRFLLTVGLGFTHFFAAREEVLLISVRVNS